MKNKKGKRKSTLLMAVLMLLTVVAAPYALAAELKEESIYGPYDTFPELYNAYMDAVEQGDMKKQDELLEIGHTSLLAEIERSKETAMKHRYNPDEVAWAERFPEFFSYGYFEQRDTGWTLSMAPHTKHVWSDQEKSDGWQATYFRFYKKPQWNNTDIMEQQFYCHARLGYSFAQDEWNLEPWRTSMNWFTCN
ncbi:MAG TPA: hypothetical protein DCR07_05325 [Lactococcus sp.]|nr:hypothetical protein [Lactococcus sp.]